eukprot:gene14292-15779_t
MDVIVNTAKRKRKSKEGNDGIDKAHVPRTAHDLNKLQLEKLLKDPDKPVELPRKRKEWKPRDAPEFVRHVMGSSAGAGSGEFHVYRGIRERETKRNEWLEAQAAEDKANKEYHNKIEMDKSKAEQRTAKLREKRQKKKRNRLKNKKQPLKIDNKGMVEGEKSEGSCESEEDVDHFVIGGK